ncbi:hypothetical protein HC761_01065, partial [bacterium]|nr:hypothetical protein [bacterium]
ALTAAPIARVCDAEVWNFVKIQKPQVQKILHAPTLELKAAAQNGDEALMRQYLQLFGITR